MTEALVPATAKLLAEQYSMSADEFLRTLVKCVFPTGVATPEQLTIALGIIRETGLNPFTGEIKAFLNKQGNIQFVVMIDGDIRQTLAHPAYENHWFTYSYSDGCVTSGVCVHPNSELVACTVYIQRKDKERPYEHTELVKECWRDTDVWKTMPRRAITHKTFRQGKRYAFGAYLPDQEEIAGALDGLADMGASTEQRALGLKERLGVAPGGHVVQVGTSE